MRTAVLIDGGYFVKRFQQLEPHNKHNAERAADCAFRWALMHLTERVQKPKRHELYRIFFYDCPPLEKRMHHPLSKRAVDFSKTPEARFRRELHERLLKKRKVALRLGHLSGDVSWTIRQSTIEALLKGQRQFSDLSDTDIAPNIRQKGVDMRIGVDVASLAFKRYVDQIVLMAGDADFVPAAKLARREGIDFILDPMHRSVPLNLMEHIDGLRSTCPKFKKIVDDRTC
ncbi:NYN domain-containing protein [Paraperlucidibaca baekdonensis]|uniref:NYN domain-containing protein n=1 Tax=Paraperlucidibaca baekdonensis TaxID=748120 RepID=A0A3E0H5P5_9GAMM|nr:NYN domain-containing protein [Paraperlucidibaca baekdonensis]REH38861.1 NYN domain-containing protein [Paraperlucidibaca baekdonensis]|tara:strand:- start:3655 stop:4341 length:687 start_codon:yes stop_codon:yes gene_type:complete